MIHYHTKRNESYFYNGKINVKGIFKDDKMEGSWIAYNKEKGFIESKLSFKENQKNGKGFIFYENGKLKRMDTYLNDTLVLSICYDSIGSQIECNPVDTSMVYEKAEVMPEFPGGPNGLLLYLQKNLKYPEKARNEKLEGKVITRFIIDINGVVQNLETIKDGVGGGAADEARRVISKMPKWKPASINGKLVKVYIVLPITFKLN
jgi:TonB family protein